MPCAQGSFLVVAWRILWGVGDWTWVGRMKAQCRSLWTISPAHKFNAKNTPNTKYAWGFLVWLRSPGHNKCLGIVGGRSNWDTLTSMLFLWPLPQLFTDFCMGYGQGLQPSNDLISLCPEAYFPPHWTFQSELLKDTISVK